MVRYSMILVLACASALAVEIPDTLVVGGQTYKGVVYRSHDASHLQVMHETGAASFPIASLPADLQNKLGYNEEQAKKSLAAAAENKRQIADEQKDQVWGYNNVAAVAMGGAKTFAVCVLELNRGGNAKMTLVSGSGDQTISSGTWKLRKDGETLSYDLALNDGSAGNFVTKVGGSEGVLMRNGDIVAVFERRK